MNLESFFDELEKIGAMAGDLRVKSVGKLTKAPTEDSKQYAYELLRRSKRIGNYPGVTTPSQLQKPGQSIKQLASLPQG